MAYLVLIVAFSSGAIYLLKRYIKADIGDTLIGSILFVPALLLWAQHSGISELSGFGLNAKFTKAVSKQISGIGENIDKISIFSLASNDPDFQLAATFETCGEYFVIRPSYAPSEKKLLDNYVVFASFVIGRSISCGKFVGVVVLDKNDKYLGSYDKDFFGETLAIWTTSKNGDLQSNSELASRISGSTIFGAALKYPDKRIVSGEGFIAAINETADMQSAFIQFTQLNRPFLVMTDATGKFKGIIKRQDIVDTILLALIGTSKK